MREIIQLLIVASLALLATSCDDTTTFEIETERSALSAKIPSPELSSTSTDTNESPAEGQAATDQQLLGELGEHPGCGGECNCGRHGDDAKHQGCGEECDCGGHGRKANLHCPYLEAERVAQNKGADRGQIQSGCPYAEAHSEIESPHEECPHHQKLLSQDGE